MTLTLLVPNRKLTRGDRILKAMGKERRPVIPSKKIDRVGKRGLDLPLVVEATWEGFWTALFCSRSKPRGASVFG